MFKVADKVRLSKESVAQTPTTSIEEAHIFTVKDVVKCVDDLCIYPKYKKECLRCFVTIDGYDGVMCGWKFVKTSKTRHAYAAVHKDWVKVIGR